MKKKVISFMLRVLLMVIFFLFAYEYILDRSVKDTLLVIVCIVLPTLIANTWKWFKKRRDLSGKTN